MYSRWPIGFATGGGGVGGHPNEISKDCEVGELQQQQQQQCEQQQQQRQRYQQMEYETEVYEAGEVLVHAIIS